MLFWTPHFSVLDSTFWLDSMLKTDPVVNLLQAFSDVTFHAVVQQ